MNNSDSYKKHLKKIKLEAQNIAFKFVTTNYNQYNQNYFHNNFDFEQQKEAIDFFNDLNKNMNNEIKSLSKNLYQSEIDFLSQESFDEIKNLYNEKLNILLDKTNYIFTLVKNKELFGEISHSLLNEKITLEVNKTRVAILIENIHVYISYGTDIYINKFNISTSDLSNNILLSEFSADLNKNKKIFSEILENASFFEDFLKLNNKFTIAKDYEFNLLNIKDQIEILVLENDLIMPEENNKTKPKRKNAKN